MSKRFVFPTPLDATVELRHDNGVVLVAVSDTHPSGRPGQSFDLTGLPNGNGAQITYAAPGYVTTTQRGVLYVTGNTLYDVDDVHLVPDGSHPSGPLQPLHGDGWDLRTADGKRYVHVGATHYLLFQRFFLEGQGDPAALAGYMAFDAFTVMVTASIVPGQNGFRPLKPENYPSFYPALDACRRWAEDHGKRLEVITKCDQTQLGYGQAEQDRLAAQVNEIFTGSIHLVMDSNEGPNNGVDPSRSVQPPNVVWCRGSALAGAPCPLPPGVYSNQHLARNAGAGKVMDVQPYDMVQGYSGYPGTQSNVITGETPSASDTENSDSRSTDPAYFHRLACASVGWGGMVFHANNGKQSIPFVPGTPQDTCRIAFLAGMRGQAWG